MLDLILFGRFQFLDHKGSKYTYINILFSNHNPNHYLPIFRSPTFLCIHVPILIEKSLNYAYMPLSYLYGNKIVYSDYFIKLSTLLQSEQ